MQHSPSFCLLIVLSLEAFTAIQVRKLYMFAKVFDFTTITGFPFILFLLGLYCFRRNVPWTFFWILKRARFFIHITTRKQFLTSYSSGCEFSVRYLWCLTCVGCKSIRHFCGEVGKVVKLHVSSDKQQTCWIVHKHAIDCVCYTFCLPNLI